jgi:hypothetical protein
MSVLSFEPGGYRCVKGVFLEYEMDCPGVVDERIKA